MKFFATALVAVSGLIGAVVAQSVNNYLPSCAVQGYNAECEASSCAADDYSCLCTKEDWVLGCAKSFTDNCSGDDIQISQIYLRMKCYHEGYGLHLPSIPENKQYAQAHSDYYPVGHQSYGNGTVSPPASSSTPAPPPVYTGAGAVNKANFVALAGVAAGALFFL